MTDKKKGTVSAKIPASVAREFSTRLRRISTNIVADDPDFVPIYKTQGSACCDLKANLAPSIMLILKPNCTELVDCGFSMAIPAGYEAQIRARSSLASRGIIITNGPATIDDDYRLKIKVILTNVGQEPYTIQHKDRIAQMCLSPVWYFDWNPVDELDMDTDRQGGFGSTGR